MQLCFEQLAGKHVHLLKISGKCVRMDSKLIGSNIARQSRYELIHTTLVKFLKTCTLTHLSPEQEEREYLKEDLQDSLSLWLWYASEQSCQNW